MNPILETAADSPARPSSCVCTERKTKFRLERLRPLWPEWLALSLYTAVVAYAIPFHEPWADEAQAWQLARSLSLPSLFHTYLRYEASPGLWHFLLWILARIHVGYTGMHWVCGAIGVIGTWFLLFRSPFPRYLKLAFPFGYFLLFQYAVVPRNYALAPLLLYLVAIYWRKKPWALALILGLLANVALHASVISGGLAIAWTIEWIRDYRQKGRSHLRALLIPASILLVLYAFAIWTAKPPADFSYMRGTSQSFWPHAAGSLLLGLCYPFPLSIFFWAFFGACLALRRALHYMIPVILFAVFSGAVHVAFWHLGLLVSLIICIFWITWPDPRAIVRRPERYGRIAVLVVAATQICWCAYAVAYDHSHPYSPDPATAKFLEPFVRAGNSIVVTPRVHDDENTPPGAPSDETFVSVGVQPYFRHNIYANTIHTFWWWSIENATEGRFLKLLPTHPTIVLVPLLLQDPKPIDMNDPKFKLLAAHGYTLTNTFCGTMPIRLQPRETTCNLIFQRAKGKTPDFDDAAVRESTHSY